MEGVVAAAEAPSRPSLRLPSLPALAPTSLPKHLRHPSLPPPSGPLPRPPSVLENEEIGARLSASSPPATSSIRSKLTAFPFPTIPETGASPVFAAQFNQVVNEAVRDRPSPLNAPTPRTPSSAPLSPLQYATNGSTPASLGRQPSAHTQASSDALGENSRPSVQHDATILPHPIPYSVLSSHQSTNESRYSDASISLSQSNSAPRPVLIDLFRPSSAQRFAPLEQQSDTPFRIDWGRAASSISSEYADDDTGSTSRISRLSYISVGAAFVLSDNGDESQRGSTNSYRVENILPCFGGAPGMSHLHDSTNGMDYSQDSQIAGTLGNYMGSAVRIHPADNRFEHTYRIRRASEAEEPIYVPVYTFEPPGNFPDRSRPTAPKTAPRFLNHTPRNFSLPGRAVGSSIPRSSSDSAEMLLGESSKHDGTSVGISVPSAAYCTRTRTRQSLGISLSKLSSIATLDSLNLKDRIKSPKYTNTPRYDLSSRKETARQRFEREHSHYFHDLDRLEKFQQPNCLVASEIQIPSLRHSLATKYGVPALSRPEDAYVGDNIHPDRWPDRYKRQKRIGRSLLCVCLFMPPLWLIMAVGLLDYLVIELTDGEIWSVGRPEKVLAAWLGGLSCCTLIVAIITASIVAL
ncbi:hypothetical protein H072_5769 [Dactylellina haptotyla CBS 200.50]|uniref:Uncharacterized protein n=1 Tax=Dactylellina haptotyla (strain CBS 200.50) TaxID=1284197 RepID=S8BLU9_DACHA|nr:hypothetical protein H072_5769 [Dactylellina haptotyla CBS 200.50]